MEVGGFFAISPKTDCPHCTFEHVVSPKELIGKSINDPCFDCGHKGENWICLKPGCGAVCCSRYVKGHMMESHRANNQDHHIVLSFADFSFWCYSCDSYVVHNILKHVQIFYDQKFPKDSHIADALEASLDTKSKTDAGSSKPTESQ